ncbi:MAG TPA: LysR family transcriptional regulator [Mycobacterium sp.]|nr:LysR family transcriptional regulator [Mycobacterium sp.]
MPNAVPINTDSRATSEAPTNLRLVEPSLRTVELPSRPHLRTGSFLTPARLECYIAVAEEGAFSVAARRLCITQPAASKTISAIERHLGVELFTRSTAGVQQTEAGQAFLDEARAILFRYAELLQVMSGYSGSGADLIRVGIPHEIASEVLRGLARFATRHPELRVQPQHLSMSGQLSALRSGQLDVSFMVQLPMGPDLDSMPVAREELGVLVPEKLADKLAGADGVRLNALAGLEWIAFPRSTSPAWYDELSAILRTNGIDVGDADRGDRYPIPSVAFTALSSGSAFTLAPQRWTHPIPNAVVWLPLAGDPIVRTTWVVWPANSRRRDVARFVSAFEQK